MTKKISVLLGPLLLLALGLIFLFFYKSKRTTTHPLPPGPPCLPIVGCLPEMVRNKPTFRWIQSYMQRLDTEIACFRLGGVHVIAVGSSELAFKFFKEHDAVFATRPECMSGRIPSNGYLPTGDQWKKMRRVMATEVLTPRVHGWLHAARRSRSPRSTRVRPIQEWRCECERSCEVLLWLFE